MMIFLVSTIFIIGTLIGTILTNEITTNETIQIKIKYYSLVPITTGILFVLIAFSSLLFILGTLLFLLFGVVATVREEVYFKQ